MTAIIVDNTGLGKAMLQSFSHSHVSWQVVEHVDEILDIEPAMIIFMQLPTTIPASWQMPILVNDVECSMDIKIIGSRPVARFCGWKTFVERPVWDIAMYNNQNADWIAGAELMLNRKLQVVTNTPGLVAPRILAAIINEACYGLADNICTPADMDTAMQLGTNYPKGPIAWMHEIGKENIAALLLKLAIADSKYLPHPILLSSETI